MISYHLERFETIDDKILYLREIQIRFYHLTLIKCEHCKQTQDIPLLHTEARPNFHDYRISISNVHVNDAFKDYIYSPIGFNDSEAERVFNKFDILLHRTLMLYQPDPTFLTNWEEVKNHLRNLRTNKNRQQYLLQLNSNFNNHPHYWGSIEERNQFKKLLSAQYQKLKQTGTVATEEITINEDKDVKSQKRAKEKSKQSGTTESPNQTEVAKADNNSDDFIKVDEVMKILKISKPTVYEYRKRGIIQSYTMGRNVYYKRSEIVEALNDSKVKYGKTE